MDTGPSIFRSAQVPSTGEAVTLAIWTSPVSVPEQLAMQERIAPLLEAWHSTWINARALEFFDGVPVLVLDAIPESARRLSQVPFLPAPQVQTLSLGALVALNALMLVGLRHARICPDAFVESDAHRWLLLPDLAVDPSRCGAFHQPPHVPFWSPWHWVNFLRERDRPVPVASEFEQIRERDALLDRNELIALVRTISSAASGSARIEDRPWRSACPGLNPDIARVLEQVACARGPAGPEQFRSALMGFGARMPKPGSRARPTQTDSGDYDPARSEWLWIAPILAEARAAGEVVRGLPG